MLARTCAVCAKVLRVVDKIGAESGISALADGFIAEGLTLAQVEQVLDAEPGGEPSLRDRLTAEMTNALMRNLGIPGRQTPEDVRRIRKNPSVELTNRNF